MRETFKALKEGAGNGYFEGLIKKYLLDNPYEALVILSPERNMTARLEAEKRQKKLAKYKAGLSNDEILDLVRQTKELKEYQDTPSTKEELELIPPSWPVGYGPEAAKLIFF